MSSTVYARRDLTTGTLRSLAYLNFHHVDQTGNPQVYRWAGLHMPNLDGYLGGPAEARVCSFGYYDRGLSSDSGQVQVSTLHVTLADHDLTLRGFLGRAKQYGLLNVEVEVLTITEADWRTGLDPISYYRGLVARYTPDPDQLFSIELKDIFTTRAAKALPLVPLNQYFEALPAASVGKYAPILLGTKSDEGAADTPPTIANEPARGGSGPVDGVYLAGYGDLGGVVPTGLAVTELAGSGSLAAGRYYVRATTLDTGGVESDPDTFIDTNCQFIDVSDNAAIRVTTTSMGTPRYRFYIGQLLSGAVRWNHYLEVVSIPIATFSAYGDTLETITPGGAFTFSSIAYYVGWAVTADGRTGITPIVQAVNLGYRRPNRFAMTPVTGATAYGAARRDALGAYTREWSIPTTQINGDGNIYVEDDQLNTTGTVISSLLAPQGTIPAIPIGGPYVDQLFRVEWQGFLVCYGCGTELFGLYQGGVRVPDSAFNVGGNWAAPGLGDWSTLFGATNYLEISNLRFWVFYVRGQDAIDALSGDRPIYVNATGIGAGNDGLGDPILNIYEQTRWLLRNWIVGPLIHPDVGGDWLGTQTFIDGAARVDDDSIDGVKDEAALVFADQDGAFYLDAPTTTSTALAPLLQWGDVSCGVNADGGAMLALLPPAPTGAEAEEAVDYALEIVKDSFRVEDIPDGLANQLAYRFDYNERLGDYRQAGAAADALSQEAYRAVLPAASTLDLRCGKNAYRAAQIAQRAVTRSGRPDRTVYFSRGYHAIHRELGDRFTLTHPDGLTSEGYVDRLMQVRRISPNHDGMAVGFACWDLEWFKRRTSTGDDATALLREAMMADSLGGSRHATCYTKSSQLVPHDYRDVRIDWDAFSGVGARFDVETLVMTNASEAAATPAIYCVEDALVVGAAASAVAYNGTNVTNDTFTSKTILVSASSGVKHYRLIYLNNAQSAVATETLKGFGTCALYEL